MQETQEALRKVMPDESTIDLDEHARLIAQEVDRCRAHDLEAEHARVREASR